MASVFERAKKRIAKQFSKKKQADANARALDVGNMGEKIIAGFTAALHGDGRGEVIVLQGSSAFQLLALLGMAQMRIHDQIRASDKAQQEAARAAEAATASLAGNAAPTPPAAPQANAVTPRAPSETPTAPDAAREPVATMDGPEISPPAPATVTSLADRKAAAH